MVIYGEAAVRAKNLILQSGLSPEKAWEAAIAELTESPSSQKKGCPKGAFLGLCTAGVIADIPCRRGVPNKNGRYALVAWEVLRSQPNLSEDKRALWDRVRDVLRDDLPANHNSQMDVVVSLWREQSASAR